MKSVSQRFWEKVNVGGPDECWEWQASRNKQGYGWFGVDGKNRRANRVAWELTHGAIPDGLWVLHTCDNPSCVNPAHLFLGTVTENRADCVKKGRQASGDRQGLRLHPDKTAKGERAARSKLTEGDVRAIRACYVPRVVSAQVIADRFRVSKTAVLQILRGETWRHLI